MLTRWSDFDRTSAALDSFRRRMEQLHEDYGRWQAVGSGPDSWPRMDLQDEGGRFLLHADVPGLSEKMISLSLNQDVLMLSGERVVAVPEGHTVHRQERGSVKFNRSFALPSPVDPEKASAIGKNGVLTVSLEKAAEAKPRQITVKTS
mgnify:FL=1